MPAKSIELESLLKTASRFSVPAIFIRIPKNQSTKLWHFNYTEASKVIFTQNCSISFISMLDSSIRVIKAVVKDKVMKEWCFIYSC